MTEKNDEYAFTPYSLSFKCTKEWLDDLIDFGGTLGFKTVRECLECEQKWQEARAKQQLQESVFQGGLTIFTANTFVVIPGEDLDSEETNNEED